MRGDAKAGFVENHDFSSVVESEGLRSSEAVAATETCWVRSGVLDEKGSERLSRKEGEEEGGEGAGFAESA